MTAGKQSESIVSGDLLAVSLPAFLRAAAEQLGALGVDFNPGRSRLDGLRRRLGEERCYLAVLGQFKRGKSTLINALLGETVLPAAIVPLTSIPTFMQCGDQLTARVVFAHAEADEHFAGANADEMAEFLERFVTEGANPHNRLNVQRVDVTYPAPLLRQGLVLIDTPGIGSTFRHNTEATINFLPECDAAIIVVSADPPITEVEVEFFKAARQKLARVFFVLNKVDYLDADERGVAVAFLRQVLCEQAGFNPPPPIFCASARQGLSARRNGDNGAWQHSGLAEIERQVFNFVLTEKAEVLNRAISRQADDILADVQRRLGLTLRSLQLPLAELARRIGLFEQRLVEVDEARLAALERLARDEQRLAEAVQQKADELRPKAMRFLQDLIRACQERDGARWSEETTRETIGAALPDFFGREFCAVQEILDHELRQALLPHRQRANELVASVHRLVEELFEVPFASPEEDIALTSDKRPYWCTHEWGLRGLGPIPSSWIDRMVPLRLRNARIRRRLAEQVRYLVTRNVADLRWSTVENLHQSIKRFRDELNERFQTAIQNTRRALEAAQGRRTQGTAMVGPEVARFQAAVAEFQSLREQGNIVCRESTRTQ